MTLPNLADDARAWLDARARALRGELAAARVLPADDAAPHDVSDLKDEADERAAAVVHDAAVERDLAELREIDAARPRLAEGRYGECEDCGAAIAPQRLRAQPTAVRCTECQAAAEQRAR